MLLPLLLACFVQLPPDPNPDVEDTSSSWRSHDPDTDDGWEDEETGSWSYFALWYVGDATVRDGVFVDGHFGSRYDDDDGTLCEALGTWIEVDEPPGGCPDCAWTFTLGVDDTYADGNACDRVGSYDGMWDGFTAGWGYAPSYSYYGYDLGPTLLYNMYESYWWPISAVFSGTVSGDGESITFELFAGTYSSYYGYDYY